MAYTKTVWENAPSTNTPINSTNLNHIEQGIYDNSLKADQVGDLTTLETTSKTNLVGAINELKNAEVYSTSEVKTNKVWKDGKSIYRRIVEVNTTTTVNSAANLFQATYIDSLTHCEYTIYAGALYYFGPIPVSLYYKPSTHYFQESHTDSWWNSQPMTIIIEYTKS